MNISEICALLGYYTAYIVNSLPKFWDSRTFNKSKKKAEVFVQENL
jgi:fatty-acid desaturase